MSKIPKLRFKEFSGEWEEKIFNDIVNRYDNLRIPISASNRTLGRTPYYGANGIQGYVQGFTHDGEFILVAEDGANDLRNYPVQYVNGKIWVNNHAHVLQAKDNVSINKFLKYAISNLNIEPFLVGGGRAKLNANIMMKININITTLEEQEKIASFLTSVDTKIEQLTKKEELLQQYKKGVMQKIFNQEIRFKKDDGSEFCEWKKEKLSKYLIEYKNKSTFENEYPVLTSSNKGLMLQSHYFGENRLTERDNIGFNIVPSNFITYRSRSDNRTFTFNINTLGYIGIISTYYPVFECKNADNRFMVTLLNRNKHFIGKYSVGTSQTVLSFNELKNIKMLIPCVEEQTKIANFLSSIDTKIEQTQKQLESSKEFKKALLQQMFV